MNKLDLHGIKHEDVRRATIRFLESKWASGEEVQIITGQSIKMRNMVKTVLDEYGLYYSSDTISPKVTIWME